eukprot:jgi/Botrbrau1/12103/Bobra.0186s0024.1
MAFPSFLPPPPPPPPLLLLPSLLAPADVERRHGVPTTAFRVMTREGKLVMSTIPSEDVRRWTASTKVGGRCSPWTPLLRLFHWQQGLCTGVRSVNELLARFVLIFWSLWELIHLISL